MRITSNHAMCNLTNGGLVPWNGKPHFIHYRTVSVSVWYTQNILWTLMDQFLIYPIGTNIPTLGEAYMAFSPFQSLNQISRVRWFGGTFSTFPSIWRKKRTAENVSHFRSSECFGCQMVTVKTTSRRTTEKRTSSCELSFSH